MFDRQKEKEKNKKGEKRKKEKKNKTIKKSVVLYILVLVISFSNAFSRPVHASAALSFHRSNPYPLVPRTGTFNLKFGNCDGVRWYIQALKP